MDELVKNGSVFELLPGTLIDTAGNNVITNNGATPCPDHNGRADRGWDATGATAWINSGNLVDFDITKGFTLFYACTHPTSGHPITLYSNATTYVEIWDGSIGAIKIVEDGVEKCNYRFIQVPFTPNNIEPYCAVYDPVNGGSFYYPNANKLVRTENTTASITNRNYQLWINRRWTGAYQQRKWDKIKLYNRVLTESEIKKLYNEWSSH